MLFRESAERARNRGSDAIMLGPLEVLSASERHQVREALDWLVTYVDSDQVALLMREDATQRGGSAFSDFSPESWQLLAEIALESIVFPLAISLQQADAETSEA